MRAYGTLEQVLAFHRQVLGRLQSLPSVQQVTFDNNLPMSGKPRDPVAIRVAGQRVDEEARNPFVHGHLVPRSRRDGHCHPTGSRLRRPRSRRHSARGGCQPATGRALVARRDPIGQRVEPQSTGNPNAWQTVVGVAAPVLHHELDGDPGFDMYRPYTQVLTAGPYYVIRTAGDPMAIAQPATRIVGETDPNQSFLDVQTYDTRVVNRMWQRRLAGVLFGSFAVLAITLAAVGLYGGLVHRGSTDPRNGGAARARSHHVWCAGACHEARTGAGRGRCGVRVVAAFGLTRVMASMLYKVSPADPATFVAGSMVMLGIAAVACYAPARRASRVDPIVALRAE